MLTPSLPCILTLQLLLIVIIHNFRPETTNNACDTLEQLVWKQVFCFCVGACKDLKKCVRRVEQII